MADDGVLKRMMAGTAPGVAGIQTDPADYLKGLVAEAEQHLDSLRSRVEEAEPDFEYVRFLRGEAEQDLARAKSLRAPTEPEMPPAPLDPLAGMICPAAWQGTEPPAQEWIVTDWLPVGSVTSLYGDGGVGKTLLAQQLQTACALGRPFLGLETQRCRSIAFYCEDDGDTLHRRQAAINAQAGASMLDLGDMGVFSRVGMENTMFTISPGGIGQRTEFFARVLAAAKAHDARLVILDNAAQLFGGNENSRSEVTAFVNALSDIAQQIRGAVLLLGHTGKGVGSEYSGSTAWNSAVRSRWLFGRPQTKDGAEADEEGLSDLRTLRKAKANHSGLDDIAVRWDRGAFRREGEAEAQGAIARAERDARDREDETRFLACLDTLARQGRFLSDKPNASTFAPKAMHGQVEVKGIPRKRLEEAMDRLFRSGAIVMGTAVRSSDRHKTTAIVRAPEPTARYGDHRQ